MSLLTDIPSSPTRPAATNGIAATRNAAGTVSSSADGRPWGRLTTSSAAARIVTAAATSADVTVSPGSLTAAAQTTISAANPTAGASHDQLPVPARLRIAWPTIADARTIVAAARKATIDCGSLERASR